ncbi:hypothetical protein T439DRAFT_356070 [Meredithblackwellia eburnea MCA 4105]
MSPQIGRPSLGVKGSFPPDSPYEMRVPLLSGSSEGGQRGSYHNGAVMPRWSGDDESLSPAKRFLRLPLLIRVALAIMFLSFVFALTPVLPSKFRAEGVPSSPSTKEAVAEISIPRPVATATSAIATESSGLPEEGSLATANTMFECGDDCKFLFVGHIGGQETRAGEHLYRWGLVALSLNRILVLPNSFSSQIGSCLPKPFDFYYDPTTLARFGIKTVLQAEFVKWLDARDKAATAQQIGLEWTNEKKLDIKMNVKDQSKSWFKKYPCYGDFRLDFTEYTPTAFVGHQDRGVKVGAFFVESMVNFVRDVKAYQPLAGATTPIEPDVVMITQIAPFWKNSAGGVDLQLIQRLSGVDMSGKPAFDHLAYSKGLADMTKALVDKLSPFVGIHWRTEQMKTNNLDSCATALMKKLKGLKATYPSLKTVYLATDYPFERFWMGTSKDAHSKSYHIPPAADRAMERLYKWFQEGEIELRQTSWSREEEGLEMPDSTRAMLPEGQRIRDLDLSMLGQIDKSVLFQADYFIAGSQGQCGKTSSWTGSVVTARRESLKGESEFGEDGMQLWNDVEFFSI